MVVNGRPMKRMKMRVTADLYDFLAFPAAGDFAEGPFRTTVKSFLTKHALLPPPGSLLPHLLTWQIWFRVGEAVVDGGESSPAVVCLDVVEEDVARSRSVYCDQCRVVGWSGNPVCTKRYHFIIKADGNSIGGYYKSCTSCGVVLHLSDSRCKSCNKLMTADDTEDWVYHQLDDTTHLLHGVVHANGYGHLLRVNGREGGSRILSGCHIMDFWDRLCKNLGVRKVSVMDVSKKHGLEFRLLHAITKGHPWYGEWGYEFGAGSFALTLDAYKAAVETLSTLPLSIFVSQGRKPRTHLQDLISYYQSLSERELVHARDLFCFLMSLIHDAHKSSPTKNDITCKKRRSCTPGILCAWTRNDIERVEEAMFRVLRAVTGSNWVSWRALRGAVCKVAPPELLDYCLKELGGKLTSYGVVVHVITGIGHMGSVGNSDPWAPYDGYRDCSQGICNEYCPQWCYIIFSPPPPSEDDSGTDFSPLILAIIGILASAFLLVIYFTVISKYCRRRRGRRTSAEGNGNQDEMVNDQPLQVASTGLEEGFIKSITVYKYKKSGGVVEGTDCSVCLSEFEDGENLRLLPKCNHAFHLPCIDTWLKSHSSCPLCRFDIRSAKILPPELSEATQGVPPNIMVSALEVQSGNRSLLIIHDLESGTIRREAVVRVEVTDDTPKATSEVHRGMENSAGRESTIEIRQEGLLRRSISFDSSCEAHVAIPDILHSSEDHSLCFPMENMNEREAMPVTMRRSISTGRFMPLRHGKRSPCVFPN